MAVDPIYVSLGTIALLALGFHFGNKGKAEAKKDGETLGRLLEREDTRTRNYRLLTSRVPRVYGPEDLPGDKHR